MNPQAEELNNIIQRNSPIVYDLLSKKGREIFFPKKGILAQTADAKGKKINATIGIALEEDGSPMRLKAIAAKIKLDPKDIFPYAPSFGKQELRVKWKEMMYGKNPSLAGKEISLPIVSNALTHGLTVAAYLFINPGDKIIMPDLFWGNYKLMFQNAYGAEFDLFETFDGNKFNIAGLREKLLAVGEKIIVLLNFPNNPTGYTPTDKEAAAIIEAVREAAESGKKVLLLIDDAYFGLVYKKGVYVQSLFSELADLHENVLAIKLDGATKEDYVWGLRVGFITYGLKGGNKELYGALENKTSGTVRGSISNDSHLSQSLVYHAFSEPKYQNEKKKKFNLLRKRFKAVERVLKEHKEYKEEFIPLPFNSGYFMCVRPVKDAEKIRQILLQKYDTGVIVVDGLIRLAFSAVRTEDIPPLFANVYNACKEVYSNNNPPGNVTALT
ncbi:MAG TPA: aminotransferase class I/II-fold pyridoxal phosphate-dependent enzyme [Candidatus Nanoarchaeia archaeon]|nr:aminotransferase class I/II-fold pyridoxal phosphate-dependent enzyme [Candidatus Nanoarchaeia archaeon]